MIICNWFHCLEQKNNTNMDPSFKHTVLVTGFGPFGEHKINASWEAVKELKKISTDSKELCNVRIIAEEIPVVYNFVSNYVPKVWEKYEPTIVIHVGVSHQAHMLTIEQCAPSSGYMCRPDVLGQCVNEDNVEPKVLETEINIEEMCVFLNNNSEKNNYKVCVSRDAGRYLCAYIYYHSLKIQPNKTLFIHVPDLNKYSKERTAKGLHDIICYLLKNCK